MALVFAILRGLLGNELRGDEIAEAFLPYFGAMGDCAMAD
jgi:hypothetical protein